MNKNYLYIGIGVVVIIFIFVIYNFMNKSLQLKQAEIESRSDGGSKGNSLGGIFDIVNMAAGAIGTAVGSAKKAKDDKAKEESK